MGLSSFLTPVAVLTASGALWVLWVRLYASEQRVAREGAVVSFVEGRSPPVDYRTILANFCLTVVLLATKWLNDKYQKKAPPEEGSPALVERSRQSLHVAEHAVGLAKEAKLIAERSDPVLGKKHRPAIIQEIKEEVLRVLEPMVEQKIVQGLEFHARSARTQTSQEVEHHTGRWGQAIQSQVMAIQNNVDKVRQESKSEAERIAKDAARESVADLKEQLNEHDGRISNVDQDVNELERQLERNLGKLEGSGVLNTNQAPPPRRRDRR